MDRYLFSTMFPDELDLRLLKELKKDSRRSVRQLAKSLNESPSTVYNRVKRLEAKSVIRRWTVSLDYEQLDLDHIAFVFVSSSGVALMVFDTIVVSINISDIFVPKLTLFVSPVKVSVPPW